MCLRTLAGGGAARFDNDRAEAGGEVEQIRIGGPSGDGEWEAVGPVLVAFGDGKIESIGRREEIDDRVNGEIGAGIEEGAELTLCIFVR